MRRLAVIIVIVACMPLVIGAAFSAAAAYRERDERVSLAPREGRFVHAGDVELYIEEFGTGDQTAIIVHGMAAWSGTWRPVAQALADDGWRVIAVDMPPFGFSERPGDRSYWREAGARRLVALSRELELDRPLLIAHSYGSRSAFEALLSEPHAFRGIVAISPALDGIYGGEIAEGASPLRLLSHEWLRYPLIASTLSNPLLATKLLQLFMYRKEAATSDIVALYQAPSSLAQSTSDLGHWVFGFLAGYDTGFSQVRSHLASLTLPVALIWGREDTTTPLRDGEALRAMIPGATITILEGVGHMPHLENPASFTAALIDVTRRFRDQ